MTSKIKKYCLPMLIVFTLIIIIIMFFFTPTFGRLPQGNRLERIKQSENYKDGQFENLQPFCPQWGNVWKALLSKKNDVRPSQPIAIKKCDLNHLDPMVDVFVWFGHSSYLLQLSGMRFLVDPVFFKAAPIGFLNREFKGTNVFSPEDLPNVDFLIISHDHWDHLDYQTIKCLKNRIEKVVCPLGIGEYFEYWGYDSNKIVELDWNESFCFDTVAIHCLTARHRSGRGLISNKTLWASFLIETCSKNVFLSGDGGYGTHFKQIGERFSNIDLAILENGQYNEMWYDMHLMPQHLSDVVNDLAVKSFITVHHSKYALSNHSWDEPLKNEQQAAKKTSAELISATIGEVVELE